MKVALAYGQGDLTLNVPDTALILESRFVPGVKDEQEAIRNALRNPIDSLPLSRLVNVGDKVVIVHSDITRPTPNHKIIPAILHELEQSGIDSHDITLLNALGTHRPQTDQELKVMLGDSIVDKYKCVQHSCWDDRNLVSLGTTSLGNRVRINRSFLEADVKIITGFIEPHFFAGFSGGPKGVLPSIAGIESVISNHSFKMIADPNATWGITEGNPIWDEMLEVALKTSPTFLVNVTLNRNKDITKVFAGDLRSAHKAGCEFCRETAMIPVRSPFDIVITSNSGYPLDLNLYQSVKGMSAAAQIVKKGGSIIIASECRDGIPDYGKYAELLHSSSSIRGLMDKISQPGFASHDQWQVHMQAKVQLKAEVFVYSDGLTNQQIEKCLLNPTRNIEKTIEEVTRKSGASPQIAVLPEGPQTVPFLVNGSDRLS